MAFSRAVVPVVDELVEDHHVRVHQPMRDVPLVAAGLLLLDGADQFDRGEEPHTPVVMLDGLHTQCRGDVGLARTRATDEHHVLGVLHEPASVQLPHQGFVDLAVREVEACEVPVDREACELQLVRHRAHLAFSRLGLEQLPEHWLCGFERR
ncbi:hypothetical protein J2W36_003041 [Variovorax ginsengisoli]|uniref:Uncharacterized protein n=1 Tax=Variovorax ginsengisoli TaxID=363844 RepID=A0ABT9S8U7_9BURK|nr:hypothetical protein [Variovorax ginsengisoli]